MPTVPTETGRRLWRATFFLPESARLLGTHYRLIFEAHAAACQPEGESPAVADALAFVEFALRQERINLLPQQAAALHRDARRLNRRFKLCRRDDTITAKERFRWLRWVGITLALAAIVPGRVLGQSPAASAKEAMTLYLRMNFRAALPAADAAVEGNRKSPIPLVLRARIREVLGDQKGSKEDAVAAISKLKRSANSTDSFVARASARLLKGDVDEALAEFEMLLGSTKDCAEAYAGRARAWRAKGSPDSEMADLGEAIRIDAQPLYYHNRALAFYDLGKYDKALADLGQALKLNARSYASFGLMGSVLARQGDATRALKAYNKAIAINPDYAYAYMGRAALHLSQGEDEAGFKDLDQAVFVDSRSGAARFNRAEAYWKKGRKSEALTDYLQVVACERLDDRLALTVADRFAQALHWKDAVDVYARAHALNPGATEPPQAWNARASLALSLGRMDEALKHLDRALTLDPKNAMAYTTRGKVFLRKNKTDEAMRNFNEALACDPKFAEAYNDRGVLYANALGDMDRALAAFSAAVKLAPDVPDYHFNLGMADFRTGRYLKAVESFNASLALKGSAVPILAARAQAEAKLADQSAALRDAQAVLEQNPKDPAAHAALGAIRLAAHDEENAIRDLTHALRLDSELTPALLHRGEAYGTLRNFKAAAKDFKKAANIDPKSSAAWTSLCMANRLNRDFRKAFKNCSRALAADPAYGPAFAQRGLAALRLGRIDQAVSDLATASRLGTRRAESLLGESYAHILARQYKEAHKDYLAAMDIDSNAKTFQAGFNAESGSEDAYSTAIFSIPALISPDLADPDAFVVRADALHNAGESNKAIQEYTKAMESNGTLASAYTGRGFCLSAQESYDAAHQDFIRAKELEPSDASIHLRLAALLTAQRRYKDALDETTTVLKLDPNSAQAYLRIGNVRYFEGAYEEALESYRLAVQNDKSSAAAYNGMGMGYFALRRYPEAIEAFSHAVILAPLIDLYRRNRASAYVNLRQFANAAAEYKSAAFLNTNPAMVGEYKKLIEKTEKAGSGTFD